MCWLVAALYLFSAVLQFIGLAVIYNLDKKTLNTMNEELAARKASALLGRPVQVVAVDKTKANTDGMDHFLNFGRQHPDVINIK